MTTLRTPITVAVVLALMAAPRISTAQSTTTATPQLQDLVTTAQQSNNFNTFVQLLTVANLTSTLQGSAPFTVFAPTDAAFQKLPKGTLEALQADTVKLKKVLLYHIVSGKYSASKLINTRSLRTLSGSKIHLSVQSQRVDVNKAMIIQPDLMASNGVIQGIDGVLMPPRK
jgi:transforming growth factor-beta-induced protein